MAGLDVRVEPSCLGIMLCAIIKVDYPTPQQSEESDSLPAH